ncbi:uncharacterized protein LOC125779753 [Bactrocera dorsalis]|uniref:Uncharacterized protein LOC125779753 n=1 Tax=Bactrocera dorsalis TaxID=27457 RepID=A0ABM3K675_BACDO|nr:uncharacterized protein LOC125779753 [Bactrocera dorsalis]
MDIAGPLPPCKGYRYCLTIVDRYSRWLEALPLEDMTTETIAFNFYTHWIARFGVPSRVTTDQGYRSSWRDDLRATPEEMVYGNTFRLPGQFFAEKHTHNTNDGEFVENLRIRMQSLKPSPTTNNSAQVPFVEKNLHSTPSIFVRNDSVHPPLQPPYEGPFPVIECGDKFFKVKIRGKDVNISIDRLKAALVAEDYQTPSNQTIQHKVYQIKSGRW